MVSISTIKRLADATEALEARFKPKKPWKTVFMTHALEETSERAWARHLAEHPEDEDADVVISTFYEPLTPGDLQRANELNAIKGGRLRLIGRRGEGYV